MTAIHTLQAGHRIHKGDPAYLGQDGKVYSMRPDNTPIFFINPKMPKWLCQGCGDMQNKGPVFCGTECASAFADLYGIKFYEVRNGLHLKPGGAEL